jgi:hypothetical protein
MPVAVAEGDTIIDDGLSVARILSGTWGKRWVATCPGLRTIIPGLDNAGESFSRLRWAVQSVCAGYSRLAMDSGDPLRNGFR